MDIQNIVKNVTPEGGVTYTVTLPNNVVLSVPDDPDNSDYAEIMRQVEAGELTIQEAGE